MRDYASVMDWGTRILPRAAFVVNPVSFGESTKIVFNLFSKIGQSKELAPRCLEWARVVPRLSTCPYRKSVGPMPRGLPPGRFRRGKQEAYPVVPGSSICSGCTGLTD